jgi:hypothetical protein
LYHSFLSCLRARHYTGWPQERSVSPDTRKRVKLLIEQDSTSQAREELLRIAHSLGIELSAKERASITVGELEDKITEHEPTKQRMLRKCCGNCCGNCYGETCAGVAVWMMNLLMCPLKGWFTVDLLSCLPISYILLIASDGTSSGSSNSKGIRVVRLLRLAKLMRLSKFERILSAHYENLASFYALMSGAKAMAVTLFMSHMTGCLWHWAAYDPDRDVTLLASNCTASDPCSWLDATELDQTKSPEDDLWERYTTSIYFATTTLSTVGYGDILPTNAKERVLTIVLQVAGTMTFAYTAGTLSSIILEGKNDPKVIEYNEKMPKITEYLKSKHVPDHRRMQIRAHFDRKPPSVLVVDRQKA